MSSAYDKLRRILVLEREQGCQNRAVIGGLSRFLTYWAKQAREEAEQAPLSPTIDDILASLDGYADAPREARCEVVERLVTQLAEARFSPVVTPPPAPLESESVNPPVESEPEPEPSAPEAPAPAEPAPEPAPPVRPKRRAREAEEAHQALDASVTTLKGVSTVNEERLGRLGVFTVKDLIYHLPRRYEDFGQLKTINRLALGDEVTIVGVVRDAKTVHTHSGQVLVRTAINDGTGSIEARWFNQPFLEKRLKEVSEIVISGRVEEYLGRLVFTSPEWEPLQRELLHTARLVPIYPLTEGVSERWLRRLIKSTLDYWAPRIVDPLPGSVIDELGLMDLGAALNQIHFPDDQATLERARQRLCFDEFLLLQLGILRHRQVLRQEQGRAMQVPTQALDEFVHALPFALTGAQNRAIETIVADLQRSVPMSRLLQGDVGSGKTVVALAAMLVAVNNEHQAALMAPTSILAEQHYRTLTSLLAARPDIRCALLTGSLPAGEKQRLQEEIAAGQIQMVVGTHALIQSTVNFANLGLVVVDEQHRFGVSQRTELRDKATACRAHLLAMSATPIPRTLALTLYGDLDISVLDELPPNRQRVITAARDKSARERIYSFIRSQVAKGRQAFIICPLVEESDRIDARAAVTEHQRLQEQIFPQLRLGLLHGRMSADEKDQVMADFKAGHYHILVSTAVVEVGIDVPNATVILIEGAERFGLAQLHQFRGRVGRGEYESYCILLSDDPSETSMERLRIMEETTDGFVLAEKDLEMRGPGDFFGVRQSGLPMLKVARLSDTPTLEKARAQALRIFEQDPELALPEHEALAASVKHFWTVREDLS